MVAQLPQISIILGILALTLIWDSVWGGRYKQTLILSLFAISFFVGASELLRYQTGIKPGELFRYYPLESTMIGIGIGLVAASALRAFVKYRRGE